MISRAKTQQRNCEKSQVWSLKQWVFTNRLCTSSFLWKKRTYPDRLCVFSSFNEFVKLILIKNAVFSIVFDICYWKFLLKDCFPAQNLMNILVLFSAVLLSKWSENTVDPDGSKAHLILFLLRESDQHPLDNGSEKNLDESLGRFK